MKKIRFLPLNEDGELDGDHSMKETSYYKQAIEEILFIK